MIPRKALLLLQLFFAIAASQNDQTEGSGNLQEIVDQEGSGEIEVPDTDPSSSAYGKYLDTQFEPSIEEALLSSDSWMVDYTNNDNDIIFMEEPGDGGDVTIGDDEDYVAEISGNNPLEEKEEETNALAGLELGRTRTLNTPPIETGNEIRVVTVKPKDSGVHVEGNALGKTGDEETVENPVLSKYSGLSAIILLASAVAIGGLVSFIGFAITKLRPCHKGLDVP